jgi:hypothetical protein
MVETIQGDVHEDDKYNKSNEDYEVNNGRWNECYDNDDDGQDEESDNDKRKW